MLVKPSKVATDRDGATTLIGLPFTQCSKSQRREIQTEEMMPKHIRRTTQVRQDIVNIYGYIHERSPQSAERVLKCHRTND